MKYLLSLIMFLFVRFFCYSQYQQVDPQWLVLNKLGRNGYSVPGSPTYNPTLLNGKLFLESTPTPSYAAASHDLFIIFDDGNLINTRYYPFSSLSYFNPSKNNYCLNFNLPIGYQYLYLTKKYDPNLITIGPVSNLCDGNNSSDANYTFSSLSSTTTLKANHSVVPGKDITLYFPKSEKCSTYRLSWSPAGFVPSTVFDFQGSQTAIYDCPQIYNPINNYIEFFSQPNSKPYHYINLRAPENINEGLAIFKLYCNPNSPSNNQNILYSLEEGIGPTHDPNYLKVMCIKKINQNKYLVKFHVQFYNDGDAKLFHSKIHLQMPNFYDMSSLTIRNWRYGTNIGCGFSSPKFKYFKTGNNIYFEFNPTCNNLYFINHYNGNPNNIPPDKIASVEFCIIINQNAQNYLINLQPTLCETNFFNCTTQTFDTYPIHNFFDMPKDSCNSFKYCRDASLNCNCLCTPQFQPNPHHK